MTRAFSAACACVLGLTSALGLAGMGAGAAHAADTTCTLEYFSEGSFRGAVGGDDCRGAWINVETRFSPDFSSGISNAMDETFLVTHFEARTISGDLPWTYGVGTWADKRLAYKVADGGGSLTGGAKLIEQGDVTAAIQGEQPGLPIAVSINRRPVPEGARTIREWNVAGGQCRIGDRTIDVTFNFGDEWSPGENFSPGAQRLESVTVTSDRIYAPLCLALVQVTPLAD